MVNVIKDIIERNKVLARRTFSPSGKSPMDVYREFKRRTTISDKRLRSGVLPIGPGGAGAARGIIQGAKTIFQRLTSNPYSGMTARQGAASFLKKAGFYTAGVTFGVPALFAATSGTDYDLPSDKQVLIGALGGFGAAALPFPAAILTAAAGLSTRAGLGALQTGKIIADKVPTALDLAREQYLDFFREHPELFQNFTEGGMPNISYSGSSPTATYSPSFSVSAGGGQGMDPALIALITALLAGTGGYLLGRRRRKKKKKSKKRKN